MEIWHNSRCRKSREALAILEDKNLTFTVKEYLKEVPSKQELEAVLKKLGIPAEKLLRKSEAIFKENFKGQTLTNDEWIEVMLKYPKLIERPIVISGNNAVIGRPPELVLDLMGS